MRRNLFVYTLLALAVLMTACSEKKKSKDIIAPRIVKVVPKEPIPMQAYDDERVVDWIGKKYHVAIHREPKDSLPMVKDENGQKFVDNLFTLVVSREDGSVFYSKQFVKASVDKYLDDNYRKNGIFEGLVFDRVDGDCLVFAGSVGLPQTDEYIPLVIRLSRMSKLEIMRDTQMDTMPPTLSQEQSSEEI